MIKNRTISPLPKLILNVNLQEVKRNEQTILRKLSLHTKQSKKSPNKKIHQHAINITFDLNSL